MNFRTSGYVGNRYNPKPKTCRISLARYYVVGLLALAFMAVWLGFFLLML